MKKIIALIVITVSLSPLFLKADYWTQKADFGGTPRADATGFSVGSKGYIGTGFINPTYSTDVWEYDPVTNTWMQKANYGGSPIVEACSFSIDNFGYVLSAPSGIDFWQFDPLLNVWTQMANFAGSARQAAVAFAINGKGYITTGLFASSLDDLWEYDPLNNTWLQKANLPGDARHYATGFAIGNKGYVGTGQSATSVGLTDLWEWDQPTNTWSQKANFPGTARREATGFAIGNFGYIGMGSGIGGYFYDFWQYDPVNNSWLQMANFGGGNREEASQFSIGSLGYTGTGWDGVTSGVMKKDFWEYHPEDSTTGGLEFPVSGLEFTVYPNPASEFIVCSLQFPVNKKINLSVTDVSGRKLFTKQLQTVNNKLETKINISRLSKGVYFVSLLTDDGNEKTVKKLMKQ
ncbi:MAG: kelch repeat-containing protein [Bacteroidia bacterium]